MVKKALLAMAASFVILATTACGVKDASAPAASASASPKGTASNTEPVSLKLFSLIPMADGDFDTIFIKPLKEKLPYITLQKTNGSIQDLTNLVTSGDIPDMIFSSPYRFHDLMNLGLPMELDDSIKKEGIDLSQYNAEAIKAIRQFNDGKMITLPLYMNTTALFYNKDLFDKFGVPYPKDGMTWTEAAELSKRLTRVDNGTSYVGLSPGSLNTLSGQLSAPKVDPNSLKALIDTDPYVQSINLIKDIRSIPDYDAKKTNMNAFVKDKVLAMYSYWSSDVITVLEDLQTKGTPMNWDMVTTPTFDSQPGVGSQVDFHSLFISNQSKYKEQAFQVLKTLTTDQQTQTEIAKIGRIPFSLNKSVQISFGSKYASLKGKNVQALFKNKMAAMPKATKYDSAVTKPLNDALDNVLSGNMDVNTALRQAEDAANAAIQAMK